MVALMHRHANFIDVSCEILERNRALSLSTVNCVGVAHRPLNLYKYIDVYLFVC